MPNKKGVKSTTNTAHTSPGGIRLQKRRARALELRERGKSFKVIAQELKCATDTAFNYVCQAIKDLVPQETAQQILALQLRRYDDLLETFQPKALRGDAEAAKLVLKIENQRSRLCGLYPQPDRPPLIALHAGDDAPVNIQVRFVKPDWREEPDGSLWKGDQLIEAAKPALPLIEARPEPVKFGPSVLKFDRC